MGRESGCDVLIPDRQVSRFHARLTPGASGVVLEDLGSKNGTFVNGERIVPLAAQKVAPGSQIQLGDMLFKLQE